MNNKYCRYMVEENGKLHKYSGIFKSHKKAKKWYETKGKFLENEFNRKLIFTKCI